MSGLAERLRQQASNVEGEGWLMGTIRRGYAPGTYNIFTPNAQAPKTGRIMWARRALVTMH